MTQEEADQCQFVEWLDEPWPERVQESLKELWKELKVTRRCEARANQALHDALETSATATLARVALKEEVNCTKRVAQRICGTYERKAAVAVIDRSKMIYLIYCLLGVIVFLVIAIVFKAKFLWSFVHMTKFLLVSVVLRVVGFRSCRLVAVVKWYG